ITIIHELSNGVLTRINTVRKILNLITDDMDPILMRLLPCVKSLFEALPSNTQQKGVKE
ncbi:hypothetical protein K501DRAFT_128691, partial [Backusella circina FSU 941]